MPHDLGVLWQKPGVPVKMGYKQGFTSWRRDICCTPSVDLGKSRRGQQLPVRSHLG